MREENKMEQQETDLNEINLEQPNEAPVIADNAESDSKKVYGNFENVDALCKAYESLRSEYTRKSQELAKLEKEKPTQLMQEAERDRIIEEYVLSIARGEAAPKVIAGVSSVPYKIKSEPRSLREAGQIAADYFKGENL